VATGPAPAELNSFFLEGRASRRYPLSLPLAILPSSDHRLPHEPAGLPTGKTRDISTRGIYFTTDELLTPGCKLAFTVFFPPDLTRGRGVAVCAQGKVVRTEKRWEEGFERLGVAATIERYQIAADDPLKFEWHGARKRRA
jgi:hypothetical protein